MPSFGSGAGPGLLRSVVDMIRTRFAGALALTLGVLAVPQPALADAPPDSAAVQRLVSQFAGRQGYPGFSVAVVKGDQVVLTTGAGHDSTGAPVTAGTPMPVASVSKSFTSLAVMQLVEAGRVRLDAPVTEYLPGFRLADPRGARITVRDLLQQTSGITDRTFPEKSLPQPGSLAAAVTRARSARLASEPGTAYAYTNTNYHLAARVVEAVSGEPFAEYLARHLFAPAGMSATTAVSVTPGDLPAGLAKGHTYAYGVSIAATEPHRFVAGSDGVISTAADMARWLVVQNNHGIAPGGARLVTAATVTAMHQAPGGGRTYGLGWDTAADGRVWHDGIWFTYTASELLLPSGYGVAVLGNSGVGLGNEGTGALAGAIGDLMAGGRPASPAPVRPIVDLVLAALTLLSIALGVRNLRRIGRWTDRARQRPAWQVVLRSAPRLVPLVLLLTLPQLLGLLYAGGRDLTFWQLCYVAPALVGWAGVATVTNAGVLGVRLATLLRRAGG